MAKIWPVYEGSEPTNGDPWAHLPVAEAITLFELRPDDFISDLEATPRFGPVDRELAYAGYRHIVVEVERGEGRRAKWRAGFYRSRTTPKDAFHKLIRQALAAKLGDDNIVRLEFEPATDSHGRDAIKITVVIIPGAPHSLEGQAVLDALVSLGTRLHEMRDDRIPIIEYATEAELEQDANPQP